MKSVIAEKQQQSPNPQFTPGQVEDFAQRDAALNEKLAEAQAAFARMENDLTGVVAAEQKAERLLGLLTNATIGFDGERARADEVIAHCAERRASLEPRLEGVKSRIAQIRKELQAIPMAALRQRDEIRELARQLSSPLP